MHSLGLCVIHLHIDNKAFPTVFEVTNMTGPIILGRTQAKAMGYVQFPQIQATSYFHNVPHYFKKNLYNQDTHTPGTAPCSTTPTTTQMKQSKKATEPVLPHIKWNADSIQLNGKTHKLPITRVHIKRI